MYLLLQLGLPSNYISGIYDCHLFYYLDFTFPTVTCLVCIMCKNIIKIVLLLCFVFQFFVFYFILFYFFYSLEVNRSMPEQRSQYCHEHQLVG